MLNRLHKTLFCLTTLPFFISGCATIVSGTTQPIHLQAIDSQTHEIIPGALCTLKDTKGNQYESSQNPGTVIVNKGQGALTAHCQKPGYIQKQVGVGQSFNAWTAVNLIVFWPGVFVDAYTGAMQKYPSHVTVLMEHCHKK